MDPKNSTLDPKNSTLDPKNSTLDPKMGEKNPEKNFHVKVGDIMLFLGQYRGIS